MKSSSKHCPTCGTEFVAVDSRKKYCSRSCAAKMNNTVYPKRVAKMSERQCATCGKQLKEHLLKYCSHKCQHQMATNQKLVEWINGSRSGSYADGSLADYARKYLIDKASGRCSNCGWAVVNPTTGRVTLTIDHIDGNWQNNQIDNLTVLCYNCHTLTPTFGALNIGNPLVSVTRRKAGAGAP